MGKAAAAVFIFILMACLGCRTPKAQSPHYTRPPEIARRTDWSRRLPGGSFRAQTPSRIGLLVTGDRLTTPAEVDRYLENEERHAWEKSGNSQVPFHYYLDAVGNIFEGRSLECQSPPTMNLEPDGLVWIAFLNPDIDVGGNDEVRRKIVHLLAYLSFTFAIDPDTFAVECAPEAETARLCRDLEGSLIRDEVRAALEETYEEIAENPTSYLHLRTQELRTRPSPE